MVAAIGIGFTAHAGLASLDQPMAAPASLAEDRYPSAVSSPSPSHDGDYGATAAGMTGTTSLPAVPAHYVPTTDPTLVAAPPFVFRGTDIDRARATECLTTAIYYEAASEPDAGQAAVAQVILNRVRHPTFPNTVCGVIYQGSNRRGCQFSYACDGSMARRPSALGWDRARRAADLALSGRVFAGVGMATHYHTYAVTPYWNRSLVMTGVYGAHFFHRWQGFWGTPAAFTGIYRGAEPMPGPLSNAPVAMAAAEASLTPAARAATPQHGVAAGVELAQIQPAYRDVGIASSPAATAVDTLPQSTILDKWKDSGTPLR